MVKQIKRDLLAEGDDEEVKLTINKEYASKYNQWREKEELQKLKDRYGEDALLKGEEEEEESSEDDEDAKDLPYLEKGFFKALSYLKEKDPRIYDKDTVFFPSEVDTIGENGQENDNKRKKDKPMFLKDYERKIIVEKGGVLSDEDEDEMGEVRAPSPTIAEQEKALKESFKKFLDDSDSDESMGNLLKKKIKSAVEIKKEEDDYKEWLKGHKEELQDKETESDLKGLHDYWSNPKLSSDEAYLRDYILNKRFLETDNLASEYNQDDETNELVEQQEEFEHKYNFRFEQPDQEFIKRYPRCMEMSMRRKDDRRKRKRQEIRERKEAEMVVKREEIKRLKALKKKEIMEKINKIKEVTGNDDIDFKDLEDLEEDFDPQKHDQKMHEMFNDDYYGVAETKKPEFDDVDDYLEIEKWETWQGEKDANVSHEYNDGTSYDGPECEDPNFNMDCDYDPKAQLQEELLRVSKSKKKQRRKSKLSQALEREKPVFNPETSKFEDYFEEYYKLDCEDIIGDLPCRFKYRQTVPNNYGLTVDEILRADVKELNHWCSLKKVVKYKPEHVEKNEVNVYKMRAQNEALKRKYLPSLYADEQKEAENESNQNGIDRTKRKSKKHKKRNYPGSDGITEKLESDQDKEEVINKENPIDLPKKKKKKKKENKKELQNGEENEELIQSVSEGGETQEVVMKKKKKPQFNGKVDMSINNDLKRVKKSDSSIKRHSWKVSQQERGDIMKISEKSHAISKTHNKKNKHLIFKDQKKLKHPEESFPISDVRLQAYGIHPKKFKNKIKYGNREAVSY